MSSPYRLMFFIKSKQCGHWQTSTGVMLFIWESQRLYLQKKNKSPESGRWHFFHSPRSISVPLFGGSAQINLALPPFPLAPRTVLTLAAPFLSTPCSTYRFLLYGSLGIIVAIVFFFALPTLSNYKDQQGQQIGRKYKPYTIYRVNSRNLSRKHFLFTYYCIMIINQV